MKIIVAVDKKWGIGKKNDLLFHIPADLKYFKQNTLNKVIVMGSNTLKSFPNSNPLPNRTNIVLFPGGEPRNDCTIVQSLEDLSETLAQYDSNDIYIVGGAMFYKTMLPYCDELLITKIDADGEAEVFFENLDNDPNFSCIWEDKPFECNTHMIKFTKYKNNNVKKF